MNPIELENKFHLLIESIDNENLRNNFYDILKRISNVEEGHLWNRLSKDEREELLLAFEESENQENLISQEEMTKKHQKWLL